VKRFAVAPIGFQDGSLKVIVCAAILRICPGFMWMGAGGGFSSVAAASHHTYRQGTLI
jgi:hypothetical protein